MGAGVLRTALKAAAWTALAALLLATGGALLIWTHPELAVNSRSAAWALKRFGAPWAPRWSGLEVSARSLGWRDKEVSFAARDLCASRARPRTSVCLPRAAARARLRFGARGLEEVRLPVVEIEGGPVRLDLSGLRPRAGGVRWTWRLPRWLAAVRLGRVAIDLPDNRVRLASGTAVGWLSASLPEAGRRNATIESVGMLEGVHGAQRWRVRVRALTNAWEGDPRYLILRGDWDAGRAGQATLVLDVRPREDGRITLKLDAAASARGRTLRATARGGPLGRTWIARVDAGFEDRGGWVRAARLEDCRLKLQLGPRAWTPENASLECVYSLEPKPFGRESPRLVAGRLSADAALRGGRTLDAKARATLKPMPGWYVFSGEVRAAASGRIDRGLRALHLSHDARIEARAPRFEDVVAYFDGTPLAIPAPLNALHGPVRVDLAAAGDSRADSQRLAFDLRTDLRDGVQNAALRAEGALTADGLGTARRRFALEAQVALDDVSVQLPYLELQAPPKVAVDPRIRSSGGGEGLRSAPAPVRPPLPLRLRVRATTPSKPVRLHSNLVPQPVPLRLDLVLEKPGGVGGTVRVEPFDLELFRRRAFIERLAFALRPGTKEAGLDGVIVYKTPEATVRIFLFGTTEKPRVQFESDPPMNRSQILALLLFGKPPSELDPDEAASVGHTNAALTEQAFGLASLLVFASTPIDYVGYNPETHTYAVRFRLPGGATAELGADLEESRRLRVRKRISRHWALETELRREQSTERNAVTTFLEWFRRY